MLLIPAIDLKDGKCVRLQQGDMKSSTTFGDDPAAMARRWIDAGARRLHLVDLNGAFAGKPVNEGAIKSILAEVGDEIPVQLGGGIRTIEEGCGIMFQKGPDRLSPFTVPRLMFNAATGNISIQYGLQGPATAHATACASSGHAIGDAMDKLRAGKADVVLAGGAEPHAVRAALQQPHAQVRFQPCHLVADGRRGDMQLGSGQREAAPSRHRLEGLQVGNGRQGRHRGNPVVDSIPVILG